MRKPSECMSTAMSSTEQKNSASTKISHLVSLLYCLPYTLKYYDDFMADAKKLLETGDISGQAKAKERA
jgi:hypothetical protein